VRARIIAELALANGWPTIGPTREYAEGGLLLSYGPDKPDLMRGAAGYLDRILKGAKPADLPVQQPMRFEFVINKKTADALGLEIPLGHWVQATEIIE
jgi:putative ABC transport system substrate-binding protein